MRRSQFAIMAAAAMAAGLAAVPLPQRVAATVKKSDKDDESRQRKRHLQRQARKQQRKHH